MKKILFVSSHARDRVPCQRFRFEQYVTYLQQHGFETVFSSILDEKDYASFYSSGKYFKKLFIALRGVVRRFIDLIQLGRYDIVFIQREAFQLGPAFFESLFRLRRAKLIFDFDDAIWVPDVSLGNRKLGFLKSPRKTASIISYCDLVFAGNRYLADFAKMYNSHVKVVPTTIDTDLYQRIEVPKSAEKIVIGWSGSITTIKHFALAIPILQRLKKKYGELLEFRVIGNGAFKNESLGILGLPWNAQTEVEDLSYFDIGMMPLPSDEWARGKCGLKGLQFMALGIPTVMSPVGVNNEIIRDGVNGFLAGSDDEWFEKLSDLIDSPSLRQSLGDQGRKTVVEHFSVHSQKEVYLESLHQLLEGQFSRQSAKASLGEVHAK